MTRSLGWQHALAVYAIMIHVGFYLIVIDTTADLWVNHYPDFFCSLIMHELAFVNETNTSPGHVQTLETIQIECNGRRHPIADRYYRMMDNITPADET